MKLKIVGDGTILNTHVIDEDTGEELRMVQSISYEADVRAGLASVTIRLIKVPIEITVEGDAQGQEILVSPHSPIPDPGKLDF